MSQRSESPAGGRTYLDALGRCYYVEGVLPPEVCPSLAELMSIDSRPAERSRLIGASRPPGGQEIPRRERAYDPEYTYSETPHPALPLPPCLARLLAWVNAREQRTEWSTDGKPFKRFNGALVNWYDDGDDCIGKHTDNEADLVAGAPIFSASFGAERTLRFWPLRRGPGESGPAAALPLRDRTYVVMGGAMQKHYLHDVPRVEPASAVGPRVNVTFRVFKA